MAFGSNDLRVAERAARLYLDGMAPLLLMSGNVGVLTQGLYGRAEAEAFADIALGMGVPKNALLLEKRATNTGENARFSRALMEDAGIWAKDAIVVQKPYMERRTYATVSKQWPEIKITVTSPQVSYDEYFSESLPKDFILSVMVGDLQRIIEYPSRGFQIAQPVPASVLGAMQKLIVLGYDKHLIIG